MLVALIIIGLVVLFFVIMYNNLVSMRMTVKNSWSQIDVQLQRRFDLIPNLVNSVKGYMKHESEVLEKVTQLRTSWSEASSIGQKAELSDQLTGALKTIMAVSENYPDLKASQNFLELQEELRATENKISYARQFYNDSVTAYNIKLEIIPTNLVAAIFRFEKEELFKTESEQVKKNVMVDFNN